MKLLTKCVICYFHNLKSILYGYSFKEYIIPVGFINLPVTFKQRCQRFMINFSSGYWTVVPGTDDLFCWRLLKNHISDYWRIVQTTDKKMCHWFLNNLASNCWTIVLATTKTYPSFSILFFHIMYMKNNFNSCKRFKTLKIIYFSHTDKFWNCILLSLYAFVRDTFWRFCVCCKFTTK